MYKQRNKDGRSETKTGVRGERGWGRKRNRETAPELEMHRNTMSKKHNALWTKADTGPSLCRTLGQCCQLPCAVYTAGGPGLFGGNKSTPSPPKLSHLDGRRGNGEGGGG